LTAFKSHGAFETVLGHWSFFLDQVHFPSHPYVSRMPVRLELIESTGIAPVETCTVAEDALCRRSALVADLLSETRSDNTDTIVVRVPLPDSWRGEVGLLAPYAASLLQPDLSMPFISREILLGSGLIEQRRIFAVVDICQFLQDWPLRDACVEYLSHAIAGSHIGSVAEWCRNSEACDTSWERLRLALVPQSPYPLQI
jgi:hypothetical protein